MLIILATSLILPKEAFAGDGYIKKGTPHKLNLNILFMYDASYEVLGLWENTFNRASKLLYNSTEGQMQIGTVMYTLIMNPLIVSQTYG